MRLVRCKDTLPEIKDIEHEYDLDNLLADEEELEDEDLNGDEELDE